MGARPSIAAMMTHICEIRCPVAPMQWWWQRAQWMMDNRGPPALCLCARSVAHKTDTLISRQTVSFSFQRFLLRSPLSARLRAKSARAESFRM